MVNNVVNATYVETYDLRTVTGRMAILGIHTPTAVALKKMYRGFFEQYRKVKIHSCDLIGVCASSQSLSPAEVGLTAGLTDPRDVLNPILFKACTGENLDLLLDRIYSTPAAGENFGSIHREDITDADELSMYYQYLADDSFRKFHPQGGIHVSDLKPFVHRVATTQPFKWEIAEASLLSSPRIGDSSAALNSVNAQNPVIGFGGSDGSAGATPSVFISNGLEPMPWIETTYESNTTTANDDTGASTTVLATNLASSIPRIYCGVVILPPAILQPLYFRFQVRWHLSFKDFRPAYEIGPIVETPMEVQMGGTLTSTGPLYYNLYNVSSKLDNAYGSFDVNGSESVDVVNEVAH